MKHRLKTEEGQAIYGNRKCTVEQLFEIIKTVLGFDSFIYPGSKQPATNTLWSA